MNCLKNGCAFWKSDPSAFNCAVDRWRRMMLKQHGLTLDYETGLRRLVLSRKGAKKQK